MRLAAPASPIVTAGWTAMGNGADFVPVATDVVNAYTPLAVGAVALLVVPAPAYATVKYLPPLQLALMVTVQGPVPMIPFNPADVHWPLLIVSPADDGWVNPLGTVKETVPWIEAELGAVYFSENELPALPAFAVIGEMVIVPGPVVVVPRAAPPRKAQIPIANKTPYRSVWRRTLLDGRAINMCNIAILQEKSWHQRSVSTTTGGATSTDAQG